jgi:outer membrane receptor protein involved in Fe transport
MQRKLLLALAASAPLIGFAASAGAQQTTASSASTVEELVVTADKRQEQIRNVPMSVTALTGETLDKLVDRDFADYAALVPGLTLTPTEPGASRVTLRGLNAGGDASTVAVYVDESPFGSSSGLVNGSINAADFDTFDMQRVEVLRGPQGTLYGANTEGGVIKFVTTPPDPGAFAGALEVGGQDVDHGQAVASVDGMINAPMGAKAAIRISGFYEDLPGWISDPLLGQNDVNRGSKYGGRASVLLEPTDNLSIRLTAFVQDIHDQGTPDIDVDPVTLEPLHGDLTQERATNEPSRFLYQNYNATVNWDMHWANLISSTTWGSDDTFQKDDETAVLGPTLTAVFAMPLGSYLDETVNDDKFTQELRLISPASNRFEWQVGGFYTYERGLIAQSVYAFNTPSGSPSALPVLEAASVASTYQEIAGFVSGTYHFSPAFDIEAGGRYSHDNQTGTENTSGLLLGAPANYADRSSEDVFNYSVAPRWHLNDSTMLYARFSNGFRPGGPNVLPPAAPAATPRTYGPDSTVNYEAGVKTSLFEGRLSLDVAGFLIDWKNIQLIEVVDMFGVNGNGGTARSDGVEWDATLVPIKGLTFSLTGAYTDAVLTSDAPAVGGVSGDRLPWTPRLSVTLDGEYDWPVFDGATAFVGGTWSYIGDRTSDFMLATPPFLTAPSYDTVNLRGGLDYRRWRIEVYAKNVGDTRGIINLSTAGAVFDGGRTATIVQPRTVGVALSAKF